MPCWERNQIKTNCNGKSASSCHSKDFKIEFGLRFSYISFNLFSSYISLRAVTWKLRQFVCAALQQGRALGIVEFVKMITKPQTQSRKKQIWRNNYDSLNFFIIYYKIEANTLKMSSLLSTILAFVVVLLVMSPQSTNYSFWRWILTVCNFMK